MVKTESEKRPVGCPRDYQSCVNIIPGVAAGKRGAFTFLYHRLTG
jgi:hypothetical protein